MQNSTPFAPQDRVVAYLRDSGGESQELSITQQEAYIRTWCLENGLILASIYADAAQPGSSVVKRIKFLEMIEYFRSERCTEAGVVIWKYSRFSRDVDDSMYYRSDLRKRGYILYSVQDQIPDSDFGRFFESALDFTNSRFLKDMSADVKRGLNHLVTTYGAMPGTPPRGFMRQPVDIPSHRSGADHKACRWVPDPKTWELCKLAFKMRAAGSTYREISNATGLYRSTNCFPTFFNNRLYLGELVYGDLVIPNYCEPLVDQTTWDAVRAMEESKKRPMRGPDNKNHPKRVASSFLLSGLVYCVRCGAPMNGKVVAFKDEKPYTYYTCSRAGRRHDCTARKIPQTVLELAVLDVIRDYVMNPDYSRQRQIDRNRELASGSANLKKEKKAITDRVSEIQKQIANITEIMAVTGVQSRSLMQKLTDLEEQETETKSKLEVLQSTLGKKPITPEQAYQITLHLRNELLKKDPGAIKKILGGIIHKVVAEREGNTVKGIVQFYNPPDVAITGAGGDDHGPDKNGLDPKGDNLCLSAHTPWRH
ncbi:MAG: hypothetical protein CVU43_04690 [Chloroflexi bacterium HGW-Chloroflexi-5]|jgi:DNA invertase Pin-like site-specific DNA recombinase|nr:MAG: hypothetical protein CVU43_04690 [Chloroflexi bacterium HGW-Chloroflexi-5]